LIAAQINQISAAKSAGRRPTSTRGGATQADDLRAVDCGDAASDQDNLLEPSSALAPAGWRTL
jgi:hypothetical protein